MRDWILTLESVNDEIKLRPLKFKTNALSPILSSKTVDYHYNTLSKNYVKKAKKTGDAFQIADAFLHDIYWQIITIPSDYNLPTGNIRELINEKYSTFSEFKKTFKEQALSIEGSGWCCLMSDGRIITIPNHQKKANIIFIIDMWEHAWVRDYDDKEKYIDNFWKIVDWKEVDRYYTIKYN